MLTVFYVCHPSRAGRSKQAAAKENDSSEEVDVFQGSSPANEDVAPEEAEEEEVSPVNVRVYGSALCDRAGCGGRVGPHAVTST